MKSQKGRKSDFTTSLCRRPDSTSITTSGRRRQRPWGRTSCGEKISTPQYLDPRTNGGCQPPSTPFPWPGARGCREAVSFRVPIT